jgi:hypothetical protein
MHNGERQPTRSGSGQSNAKEGWGVGFFSKLMSWLTSGSSSAQKKAHPDLRPIDVQKLSRELDLQAHAKRLGEAGVPAPDAVLPTGPEQAAIQRVEKARQDYVDWAVLRLGVLNQNITKEDITQDLNRARQADQEFGRKASTLLNEKDVLLRKLSDTARSRSLELRAFKDEHGLTRDAHHPEGGQLALRWSLLALLIVVEGIANAGFFAQGVTTGLVGGAIYAMSFAALNVGVAFVLGLFVVRHRSHKSMFKALLGWAGLLLAFAFIVTVSLGIAHFRDALIAGVPSPSTAALATLKETPLQLRDLMSWGLFGISVMFGLGALVDGLYMDDLYPGYGPLYRKTRQVLSDYEEELGGLREELEELKDEELVLLDKTIKRAEISVRTFAGLVEDKKSAQSRLQTAFRDADNALNALLHEFRTENEVARRGLPRPGYFDKPPQLNPVTVPDFEIEKNVEDLRLQEMSFQALLQEFEDIRGRIQAAFNQQFDRLKPLDVQFQSSEHH